MRSTSALATRIVLPCASLTTTAAADFSTSSPVKTWPSLSLEKVRDVRRLDRPRWVDDLFEQGGLDAGIWRQILEIRPDGLAGARGLVTALALDGGVGRERLPAAGGVTAEGQDGRAVERRRPAAGPVRLGG